MQSLTLIVYGGPLGKQFRKGFSSVAFFLFLLVAHFRKGFLTGGHPENGVIAKAIGSPRGRQNLPGTNAFTGQANVPLGIGDRHGTDKLSLAVGFIPQGGQ